VVEVAYSESQTDVLSKVQDFWLKNHSRVHDVIVVKIDYVTPGETPTRMQVSYIPKLQVIYYCLYISKEFNLLQAWHFCVSDRTRRNADIVARTYVMITNNNAYLYY
jgi:hypothetical protein